MKFFCLMCFVSVENSFKQYLLIADYVSLTGAYIFIRF